MLQISKVKIGKRIRSEYGDMQDLAKSIREHGLLHPIVVDSQYNLDAGGRRLLVYKNENGTSVYVNIEKTNDINALGKVNQQLSLQYYGLRKAKKKVVKKMNELVRQLSFDEAGFGQ